MMKSGTEENVFQKRQRRLLLLLPVLVFPLLIILLWTTGVVGESKARDENLKPATGLNTSLPDAKAPSDKGWTKLNYYQQADEDSAKYRQALKNDPYYKDHLKPTDDTTGGERSTVNPGNLLQQEDPTIENVNRKLATLNEALEQSAKPQPKPANDISVNSGMTDGDIDRLESVLKSANTTGGGDDPDMQQLSRIMDKIIAVQHPEILQDSLQKLSARNRQAVYPVIIRQPDNISLLQHDPHLSEVQDTPGLTYDSLSSSLPLPNRFYGPEDIPASAGRQNTVGATVAENQTLADGSILKLCLTDDIYIDGIPVPKGSLVYGTVRLNGERLLVTIQSIRQENNILPVALSGYDLDGMAGIYIPGAITRDAAKQSGDQAIQSIGLTSLDPSLGAQAASAGIQAAKSLIGRKVKLVKVTVKAGYRLLLKNSNNQ